jgi:hypothetical protein
MKRFLTAVSQYLAVTLLVALGLNIFGCADTASVNPVAELASLTVAPGTLTPTFNSSTTQYSIDLTTNITSVTVMAQPAVAGDTLTINGQTTTSRTITLGQPGSTTSVSIVVSESGSNSRTYTVLINRAGPGGNNSLHNLIVSPGNLTPVFDANTLRYTVNVTNNAPSILVTPTLDDSAATMTMDGQPATSGQAQPITLNGPGLTTLIDIVVTALNGTQKIYLITVSRGISNNNNLRSLAISPGTLVPAFSAGTIGYTVNVASNVENISVTPELDDSTATMTVNGDPTNSGEARTITLKGPSSNTFINIVVTAENQSQKNYVIVVTRAALGDNHLSDLSVRVGTVAQDLSPTFAPNITDYTVNVASDVTIVSVTATMEVTNASMTINNQATSSGQTRDIDFGSQESSMTITISVTAPNGGVPNTYRITVNRLAPTAPTNAPDLLPEDDSGSFNNDNWTNVLTPRFTVAPLAAGETPNLYIDGVKVKEGFDQGANTLTPTSPLVGGDYFITVTSTVTNAAGLESAPSQSLSVHIDNVAP